MIVREILLQLLISFIIPSFIVSFVPHQQYVSSNTKWVMLKHTRITNSEYPRYTYHNRFDPQRVRNMALAETTTTSSTETRDMESNKENNNADTNTNTDIPVQEQQQQPRRMRVSELRKALDEWNINYSDCFDQESLLVRYNEAKEKQQVSQSSSSSSSQQSVVVDNNTINDTTANNDKEQSEEGKQKEEEDEELLHSIQQMSVKELREELGRRRISRIGLFEKNDLIQAVYNARIDAKSYSVTGIVQPGIVVDVSDDTLQQEIQNINSISKQPLLVDVYATWCGPCQLMSKQLNDVANELGNTIRIVKMDSDKYNTMASQLRVQGLPTIILFDIYGNELNRIEGAMMKDQLIHWIEQQQQK